MSLLSIQSLDAFYGDFQALFAVNVALNHGETVAIIGANGAGKTTLLRSIAGVLKNAHGSISHNGEAIGALSADAVLARGIAMVPEGRKLFSSLTVEENLLIGAYAQRSEPEWTLEKIYDLFPVLAEKRHDASTMLSGGQQQMVAIGRALMSNPDVLLCDEISLGLAPVIVKKIYSEFPKIKSAGASVIVVEQDITQAVTVADTVYCMMEGGVTLSGKPSDLTKDQIHRAYFGVGVDE
ncbi:MAG: ABC transporter ATP-binding protein [Aestuariivita sp.]|nr:ABC transporter ATP-binding protein [Aestuariivita sp.]